LKTEKKGKNCPRSAKKETGIRTAASSRLPGPTLLTEIEKSQNAVKKKTVFKARAEVIGGGRTCVSFFPQIRVEAAPTRT